MDWFSIQTAPSLVAAVVSIFLAAWLLRIEGHRWTHRFYAIFLLAGAGQSLILALVQSSTDAADAMPLANVNPYWAQMEVAALAAFTIAYVRPRRGYRIIFGSIVGLLTLATFVIYLGPASWTGRMAEAGSGPGIPLGPLVFDVTALALIHFTGLWLLGPACLLALAYKYRKSEDERAQTSRFFFLLSMLLMVLSASWRVLYLYTLRPDIIDAAGLPDKPVFTALTVGQVGIEGALGFAAAGVAIWVLARRHLEEVPDANRLKLLGFVVALALVVGTMSIQGYRGPVAAFFEGFVALAIPLIATYAVLRHHLFDVDVKARFTVKSSTLAAIFVTVIYAVSEGAQIVAGERQPWLGVAAGGLLIFALAPLQRFAERVATTAVPNSTPVAGTDATEKAASFTEVVRMAWVDGTITPAERRGLDEARRRLGLSAEEAVAIESALLD